VAARRIIPEGEIIVKKFCFINTLCLLLLLPGCAFASLIHSDLVPADSLRVAQITDIATREEILQPEEALLLKTIRAAGIDDSDLGSVAFSRIYCCGGITREMSAEYQERRLVYIPKNIKVELGDFVEIKVGREPINGNGGRLNTVTRVVARKSDNTETCWWDPRDDKLWLRVVQCEWMPKEGWVRQGGASPAWYKATH
jgi:hypothetical protein